MNEQKSGARPLRLDELAPLPDVLASAEMPQDIAVELAQERLYIAGVEDEPLTLGHDSERLH